ncbi:hypothetical protein SAMN05216518_13719 [Bacteroidales bacterium KHT7]|nr:hypothetical protein SAMN05216518_13719 [Bacteroidales bacterium KHT7]
MNKYILAFVCCLTFSLLGVAQTREIIPVDWKGIKKEINPNRSLEIWHVYFSNDRH